MPKAKKTDKEIEIKLVPDKEICSTRIYSNHVSVITSPMDFTLRFCDATPIDDFDVVREEGRHHIPVVAEIAIPIQIMPNLIKAMQSQLKKYNAQVEGGKNERKTKKK